MSKNKNVKTINELNNTSFHLLTKSEKNRLIEHTKHEIDALTGWEKAIHQMALDAMIECR